MENKEKDWKNIDIRTLDYKESAEYIWRFDRKKYQNYQKYLRDVSGLDIKNMGLLQRHLRLKRFENHMSITHLSMILGCSRTQYNRMERGENRFKDEQLETLATFYGEDSTTYKDMQDVDAIIKAAGYFKDKDRSLRLMKMALSYMFPVLDDKGKQADLTVFVPKDFIDAKPISKED
ncbi:MAG: helix-turn-helix transcriptional regulator, partial [Muribaculaceae bacterium]|nr:helix-turn-helix transcriptional regulator [Muribaculaceae bacterium]